jgi:hypothetical protein
MESDSMLFGINSQEELNSYIRKLPIDKRCAFMIERAVPLCENSFICPYKGMDDYSFHGDRKRECKRDIILRQKKILGNKL